MTHCSYLHEQFRLQHVQRVAVPSSLHWKTTKWMLVHQLVSNNKWSIEIEDRKRIETISNPHTSMMESAKGTIKSSSSEESSSNISLRFFQKNPDHVTEYGMFFRFVGWILKMSNGHFRNPSEQFSLLLHSMNYIESNYDKL